MNAQTNINLGAGYFGHTISYPGFVVEGELEKIYSEKASLPIRVSLGFYNHQRYHTGLFTDVSTGYRKYLKSGLFFEQSVGIGILQPFLNSDDVFVVDENNDISEGKRRMPLDFTPSVTIGVGYNLSRDSEQQNLIWIRPKIFWQLPHKTLATYNFALQIGFTHTIRSK